MINYKVLAHHFLCPLSAYLFQIACELQSFERRTLRKVLLQFIVTVKVMESDLAFDPHFILSASCVFVFVFVFFV